MDYKCTRSNCVFILFARCKIRPAFLIVLVVVFCFISLFFLGLRIDTSSEETMEVSAEMELNRVHDKWIITTSTSKSSAHVEKLARFAGWQLMVVEYEATPAESRVAGVLYLGLEEQRKLPYRIVRSIPKKTYSRKNIGYLYAIDNGARYIYDTDDENHPINERLDFRLKPWTTGLVYRGGGGGGDRVMNPYFHFGQKRSWPRGYPFGTIDDTASNVYTLCTFKSPSIQQRLFSSDRGPDAAGTLSLDTTFDSRAPPLVLPSGVFAPFDSQNTLFMHEAFWAMPLPSSVGFGVTDILRGYWAQRLMWLLGQKLAFYPPNAIRVWNSHEYLDDYSRGEAYEDGGRLIAFLTSWQCHPRNQSFFGCAAQLSWDMVGAKFWTEDDAHLIDSWFADMKNIGFEEPPLLDLKNDPCDVAMGDVSTVYFSPVSKPESPWSSRGLVGFCKGFLKKCAYEAKVADVEYDNVLLVVVFNWPFLTGIPVLENLYRRHFPNIVYCGEATNYRDILVRMQGENWSQRLVIELAQTALSFIKIDVSGGYFAYECAIRAMQMNYDVDGYFVVGDDVLLNFWNLDTLNFSESAYQPDVFSQSRYLSLDESDWKWWRAEMGRTAANAALDELNMLHASELTSAANDSDGALLTEYYRNVLSKSLNETVSIGLSDVYYVPRSKRELFLRVANVFYKHRVFVEITVPTIIERLHASKVQTLSGQSLWATNRKRWSHVYSNANVYLHPVKLSDVMHREDARRTYCQHYVSNFVNSSSAQGQSWRDYL